MAEDRQRARDAKTSKADRRRERMRARLDAAVTPEARLSAAFDWFRGSAARLATTGTGRDGSAPNRPAAERAMREMADCLAQAADSIDRGVRDDSR